jgi:hypothetical protein
MTLGGTVSSVMIRIRGDGSNAVKALDDVADEAKKTETALDKAAGGGDKMGMAMGAAAGAAVALAAAAAGVAAAVSAYSATNQDAADTLAGLSSRMNDMMVAVGGAIFESEGFQEALGRVAQVMAFVSENAGAIGAVVSGSLTVAINTGIVVVDAFNAAVAGVNTIVILGEAAIDAMATTVVNLGSRMRIVANAVLDFGLSIAQGVTGTMADAIGMAQAFVESLAPVARFAGIDLGAITSGLGDMRDGLAGSVEQLERMRDGLRDSTQYQRDLVEANNEGLSDRNVQRGEEIIGIYNDLDEALTATASSQAGFNFELTETGRRQREVATATAAVTVAIVEQDKARMMSAALHAEYRANVELQQTKENETRAESNLLVKQEGEALAMLRQELILIGPAASDAAAASSAALIAMLDQLTPANQALGVFQAGAQGMADGVATSFVSAALSGEKVSKAFKRQMGDMLVAQGSTALLQGALAMIPFGPQFNPAAGVAYLAQGGIMVAAGKLMSGKGGSGGQGLAGAGAGTIPAPTAPAISNNSNVTINNAFGIVGDQRQSARLVADSLGFARQEGMI